ncbi:hypothetical protein J3A78_000042 [Streptomyces sp. PvR006]|uniref:hypothetical protein n=1 Tax=Streptomyces sp. PvR006 TaxID=2817860 RepID=UPI001AE93BA5|nr:hypothetical protein [Streptomyces sp. PvR006]MBP2579564.1 hypothetical protein [Streptomyces sp. PvR006]
MRNIMRSTATVVAGVLVTAGVTVFGVSGPAQASPADCEGGANGFVDIPDNLSGTVGTQRTIGGGTRISIQYATLGGVQRGWAKIDGWTLPGDKVWMDWTTNGGSSWLQCGPFVVGAQDTPKTSAAKNTTSSSAWKFRACAALAPAGPPLCTNWW